MRDPNDPFPYITNILPQGAGTYAIASGLDFYVTYSEPVLVDGNPRIQITADSGIYYANYVSGSGTNILYFQFIVPAGAYDYNGIQLSGIMNINGGSIYDPDDNDDAILSYSIPSTTNVFLNGIDPVITSVTTDNGNYKIGDMLEINVNYTFPVHVTGTPRLPITVGATTREAIYVSGSGTSQLKFTYNIAAEQDYDGISAGGSIGTVGATITDYFGDATATVYGAITFGSVIVDGISPLESGRATPMGATKFLGSLLLYTVAYSEIVNVTGTPRVQINIGGTLKYADYSGGSGTSNLSFTYVVGPTDLDSDGIVETELIQMNGGTITDRVGNPVVTPYKLWNSNNVSVDGVTPTILTVGLAGGNYKQGDVIEIQATYSEPVTVTGSPSIGINIGSTMKQAVYLSGSATANLTFRYIVEANLMDMDGVTIVAPIALNGGTIKDLATNSASVSFIGSTTPGALVDSVRPTLSISSFPTIAPFAIWRPGSTMPFTVSASEAITINGGSPSLPITIGTNGRSATLTSTSASAMLFNYTVNASDMDLDGISLTGSNLILNGSSIRDSFGNDAIVSLAAVDMSKVFVLPNEIKYWFDASDTITTGSSTIATSFKSKADPISPSLNGFPSNAPPLVTGPNGSRFAQFSGTNSFTLTMSDADVVIATIKTPDANGTVWRSSDDTKRIAFNYFMGINTVYTGSYCNAWCYFYQPVGNMPTVTAANALNPYSFNMNQYRTIAVDYRSPGSNISYRMGEFNGQIGEVFILSSGGGISVSLIQAIGDYLNTKHGAAW